MLFYGNTCLKRGILIRRDKIMADVDNNASEQGSTAEPRTFTQDEVNAIVGERLSKERAKYAGYDEYKAKAEKLDAAEEAAKSELQKATERADALQKQLEGLKKAETVRQVREKVAADTGVPVSLLSGDDEESCASQAKAILEFARPSGYPKVRDGGEVYHTGKRATRDQFADWFNTVLKK